MGFQIQKQDGTPIPLNELDKEAAAFWQVELKLKEYANPSKLSLGTWFDVIGYFIHSQDIQYTTGWDNVKCNIYTSCLENLALLEFEKQLANLHDTHEQCKLYFDLIDHWKEKGYIPVQVKD